MRMYEDKLKKYLHENSIDAEHYSFEEICHSVEDAAKTVNASREDFVKSICMLDKAGRFIVAIVSGKDRASSTRIGKFLEIEPPRTATPEEILERTGYICGGVPAFGFEALFLVDPKVMEKEFVYTGGGSPYSLTKISTKLLLEVNMGQIVRVRK